MEIDPITGLPVSAIAWEDLAKGEQKIKVATEKRRYGKVTTLVSGFDKSIDLKATAKSLKDKLACGGTIRDRTIELQGDHKRQVRGVLVKLGFSDDSIED
ncbi:MAG: stress response translation initiation inhibitor YciH [Candidatus Pacearchaeota archaeon]